MQRTAPYTYVELMDDKESLHPEIVYDLYVTRLRCLFSPYNFIPSLIYMEAGMSFFSEISICMHEGQEGQ